MDFLYICSIDAEFAQEQSDSQKSEAVVKVIKRLKIRVI